MNKRKKLSFITLLLMCTLIMACPITSEAKMSIRKAPSTMYVGDKTKLSVKKTKKKVKWYSSNKSIATISKKGTIKAKRPGTVTITAKVKKKKLKCTIKILPRQYKYIRGTWYKIGGQPNTTTLKFNENYAIYKSYDSKGRFTGTYKAKIVHFLSTSYGYCICLSNENGYQYSYQLYLKGADKEPNALYYYASWSPYATDGYSASDSYFK